MFQYRQVLVRLRQGDSDRDIARARLMGRPKVAAFRALAAAQGWLAPEAALPDDAAIGAAVGQGVVACVSENPSDRNKASATYWGARQMAGT